MTAITLSQCGKLITDTLYPDKKTKTTKQQFNLAWQVIHSLKWIPLPFFSFLIFVKAPPLFVLGSVSLHIWCPEVCKQNLKLPCGVLHLQLYVVVCLWACPFFSFILRARTWCSFLHHTTTVGWSTGKHAAVQQQAGLHL